MKRIAWMAAFLPAGCGLGASATATSDGRLIHVDVKTASGNRVHVGSEVANPGRNGHAKFDFPSWKAGDVTLDVVVEDGSGSKSTSQVTVHHDPKDAFEFVGCAPGEAGWVFRVKKASSMLACGATRDGKVELQLNTPSDAKLTVDGVPATVDADGHAKVPVDLWPLIKAVSVDPAKAFADGDATVPLTWKIRVERPGKPPHEEDLEADSGSLASQLWLDAWTNVADGKPTSAPLAGPGIAWHRVWKETGEDGVARKHEVWSFVGAHTAGDVGAVVQTVETPRKGESCGKYALSTGKEIEVHLELHDQALTLLPASTPPVTRSFPAPGGCPQRIFLDLANPEVMERTPPPEPILAWLETVSAGQAKTP